MVALAAAVGAAGLCAGGVAANQAAPSVYQRQTDGPGAGAAEAPTDTSTDTPAAATSAAPATAAVEDAAAQAERIVVSSLGVIARAPSFAVKIRQKARVGDRVLVGTGRYLQSGTGEDQRFRFESRLSAETEEFEVLEVGDGLFFWTYRKLGSQPPTVTRIDIRRVRERLQRLKVPEPANASPYLGGIQRSLGLVREWFRFVSVSSAAIDDMPVWSIEGRWNGDRLASLLPAQAEAIKSVAGISAADLPEGLPWSVRLSIGKRALFPFRIEWLAIPGQRPVAATTPEVVAVLEFYDVRIGEPVDATAFVYKPATEGLMDVSEDYCRGLRRLRP
jgi:hypothetical protein